jgi:hypothetical protein
MTGSSTWEMLNMENELLDDPKWEMVFPMIECETDSQSPICKLYGISAWRIGCTAKVTIPASSRCCFYVYFEAFTIKAKYISTGMVNI